MLEGYKYTHVQGLKDTNVYQGFTYKHTYTRLGGYKHTYTRIGGYNHTYTRLGEYKCTYMGWRIQTHVPMAVGYKHI